MIALKQNRLSCANVHVAFGLGVLHLLQPLPRFEVPTDHVCLEVMTRVITDTQFDTNERR